MALLNSLTSNRDKSQFWQFRQFCSGHANTCVHSLGIL